MARFYKWNKDIVLNQNGQSTVEYILLFAVVASIIYGVFNSQGFNKLFGNNGVIVENYRKQVEFSYRHGFLKTENIQRVDYQSGTHESYNNRFFSAKQGYPR